MTIKDIANICGCSVSSVSRVLNNRPDVSDEVRRRVLATVEKYGFVPNTTARDLVKIKSDAVGLVVRGLQNPFFTDIIQAIESELDRAGYTMVMRQIPSRDDEIKVGAMMEREKRLRGIVFLGGRSDYSRAELSLLNVPFVCCTYTNTSKTLTGSEYSSVSIEDEQTAYEAVCELVSQGHKRIALLNANDDCSSVSLLRYKGYRRALEENGIEFNPELVAGTDDSFFIKDAYDTMQKLLEKTDDFTALFAISDGMAIGAMKALREHGKSIPEDCSVIAIDGIDVSEYIQPTLTTMCQPKIEMGRRSVEILIDMIENCADNRQITLPAVLRKGASVCPPKKRLSRL